MDLGLTPGGARQAELLADWLVRVGWRVDVLLYSTLPRARQTAALIARASLAGGEADHRLREVGSCRPDGAPLPDEAPPPYGFPPRARPRDAARPGGESWNEFSGRIRALLDDILSRHGRFADRRVALVCHAGVHNAVHDLLTGRGEPPTGVELAVCHTGIAHWEYAPGAGPEPWILRGHNIADHLAGDALSPRPERSS